MRIRRTITALVIAGVTIAAGGACSADKDNGATSSSTNAASSPNATNDNAASTDPASNGFDLSQDSFFDEVSAAQAKAGSYHMELTTAAVGMTASADCKIGPTLAESPTAMTMTIPGAGAMEIRLVDGLAYMSMGDTTDNKFVKIDPNDTSNPIAQQLDGIVDPLGEQKQYTPAIETFEKVGTPAVVNGVQAQQYDVVVNTDKLPEAVRQQSEEALPTQLVFTYWVNADAQPVKVTTTSMGVDMVMEFSKWGEPVNVTAPTADQITDIDPFATAS